LQDGDLPVKNIGISAATNKREIALKRKPENKDRQHTRGGDPDV